MYGLMFPSVLMKQHQEELRQPELKQHELMLKVLLQRLR